MRVLVHRPGPPLAGWVASIWYFEGAEIPHALERILPNGTMQLLVNLYDDELRWCRDEDQGVASHLAGGALAGAFSRPFTIDTAQQRLITGVTFTPGGGGAFFGGSMRDFTNDHVQLADLPGCGSIREELLEAQNRGAPEVLGTWECFLRRRWMPDRFLGIRHACERLEAGLTVQEVADDMSFSVRKLRQDFAASVGLTPKTYSRVHRFQRLLSAVAKPSQDRDWARLAIEHGYFDQSHMIHDFRALTGTTPMAYCPRSPDDWNHAVIPDT